MLAGGAGRRLAGAHKPSLDVGGRPLLDIALAALGGAAHIVAVGPPAPTARHVVWSQETPPGGGPVAALAAGLLHVKAPTVVVLAADLPFVTPGTVDQLLSGRHDATAAIATDDRGYDQPLLACYATAALRAAIPAEPRGASMRDLVATLAAAGPVTRVELGGDPPPWWDCDTPADLIRARKRLADRTSGSQPD